MTRLMPDRSGALRQVATTTTPRLLTVEDWPAWAHRLKPQLALMAAGSGGRYVADDIDSALWSGRMRAWVAECNGEVACLLLTETIDYPRFCALRLVGFVGERPEWTSHGAWPSIWLRHSAWLEDQARGLGCVRLEALHPTEMQGLLRAWSPKWRVFHVLSEKPL
jgi:hypothetical protein